MKSQTIKRLVTSAVMLSLAMVLSMIKVWKMPLGGSVTLLSMLPVCILSIKYGVKWGLFSAFVYGVMQMFLDLGSLMSWGMTVRIWIGCIVFDYILAYTVLGLSGSFQNKGVWGIIIGIALSVSLRFVCHFISGTIFFDIWCPDGWNLYLYSICYNGTYMLPEMIFTVIGAVALFKVPQTTRLVSQA